MSKKVLMPVLCLAGVALNIGVNRFFVYYLGMPLFMDTIFTVAVTLVGGVFWGAVCGALSTIIGKTIWFSDFLSYLFFLCSIATAFITWFFVRFFPGEIDLSSEQANYEKMIVTAGIGGRSGKFAQYMNRVIVLILLSFALCMIISVLGGLISTLILFVNPSQVGERVLAGLLSDTMSGGAVPVFLAEILSRIPVNIIDRLIAAFGGYGVAVVVKKVTVTM
jgi:hypothetical protein